ncbi:ComF family protein [Pedobacter africanus]|uniref:ComF family protein n=1 Tax=Pedobacter africanus TaxID=151894 RepID=A0ACC6L485_9SPHI|nr:phosphoribosyltransferase family protein [Pedobacter africanus]MDR6786179.1 ComF family protein [Pedobacter africanus]
MMLLKNIFRDLLALLFPNLCCGCDTHLYKGEDLICTRCLYRLPYTDYHVFPENKAAKQLWGRVHCNAVMSLLYFKKGSRTQNLIHHLKYRGGRELGVKLGHMIAEKLIQAPAYSGIDLIVPVPLHPRRERSRGYNQSMCIAEGIGAVLNVPVSRNGLIRTGLTKSQTKKGRYDRFRNMQAMFEVRDTASFKNLHILLVDDVMTTGATLEACCIALQTCSPAKISIATVAYAE